MAGAGRGEGWARAPVAEPAVTRASALASLARRVVIAMRCLGVGASGRGVRAGRAERARSCAAVDWGWRQRRGDGASTRWETRSM